METRTSQVARGWNSTTYTACQLSLVIELLQNIKTETLFSSDIVPPKVLVKDFMESLKKKSRKTSIEIHSSSSDSESE